MTAIVLQGDARALPLPDASVDLIVTSPPYWALRDYRDGDASMAGQIGSEATPAEWVAALVECTAEWARVLKPAGSMFVNLGDKYSSGAGPQTGRKSDALMSTQHGHGGGPKWATVPRQPAVADLPPKSLLGLPWRYALACTDQLGLILRRDIIWAKPNGLPESVTDRCRSSHEYLFHLVRQPRYYAAVDEIRTPHAQSTMTRGGGRNGLRIRPEPNPSGTLGQGRHDWEGGLNAPGSVWSIPSQPLTVPAHLGVDHFAAYPVELPRRCVLGWSPPGICTSCGEGRRPVVAQHVIPEDRGAIGTRGEKRLSVTDSRIRTRPVAVYGSTSATITGYACACPTPDAPTRPAIVLDPFMGTGTTLLAAAALGRTGIGVDLSADYCRLARWRVTDPGERAKAMQVPKPPPIPDGMEALF